MISIKVGNVVRSVGFGIYRLIMIIKTDIAIDIVKNRSKTALGRGTIMIVIIAMTKNTSVKSFDLYIELIKLFKLRADCFSLIFANIYILSYSIRSHQESCHLKNHQSFVGIYSKMAI